DVVSCLIDANQTMQTKLQTAQSRITEQADQLESAERRAQTDALTRVSNRGAFDEHLARRHALGPGRAGTLMLLDVDHFKRFNDEHGHRAGDEVLKVVAKMLHARLKSYGIVARFGGEEFAAIIDGYTVEEAKQIVESARAAIGQRRVEFEGKRLTVTASIGLAELLEAESIEQWIERADSAMYHSKKQGRDCGHYMNIDTPVLIDLGDAAASIPDVDQPLPSQVASPPERTGAAEPAAPATTTKPPADAKPRTAVASRWRAAATTRGAFSSLPSQTALAASLQELQARPSSPGSAIQIMRLHVSGKPAAGAMRTLLQLVRATLRSVDRIGAEDDATLLVCLPGLSDDMVQERAQQIRASAESLRFGNARDHDSSQLEISLVTLEADQTLDDALTRSRTASPPATAESSSTAELVHAGAPPSGLS
ncbi:MAG: GGDEF domain-containing protein, partial [Novipirellula sp. JB048]